MTVYDIIEIYGYRHLISLVENRTGIYVVTFADTVQKCTLTGVKLRPIDDNELVFEVYWNFLYKRIFFSEESAENYLKQKNKTKE